MKKLILFIVLLSFSAVFPAGAQTYADDVNNNPAIKMSRGYLKNSGTQKKARNILVLFNVTQFKLNDEELKKDFDELENNQKFETKMQSVMDKLNNKKLTNSKNKKVKEILDEAGNKLYNLLAD